MRYIDKQYVAGEFIEHDIHIDLRFGGKGKREKKKKPTPLQIRKQNHWNKVKSCRRTIQLNFNEGDLWLTLAYKGGVRKPMEGFKKDIAKFHRLLKAEGINAKWIRRLEIGKRGGLHAHYVMSKCDTEKIARAWAKTSKDTGRIYFTHIDSEDGYNGLAEYICKEPTEEIQGQISFLIPDDRKRLCSISTSRNLIRPEAEKREVKVSSIKRVIRGESVIKPTDGFYIEPSSVRSGLNRYGYPYLSYREKRLRIDETKKPKPELKNQKPKLKNQKPQKTALNSKKQQKPAKNGIKPLINKVKDYARSKLVHLHKH